METLKSPQAKVLLRVLLLFITFSYSQQGPGGVGDNDGSSSLKLWLDASRLTTTSGTALTN